MASDHPEDACRCGGTGWILNYEDTSNPAIDRMKPSARVCPDHEPDGVRDTPAGRFRCSADATVLATQDLSRASGEAATAVSELTEALNTPVELGPEEVRLPEWMEDDDG